MTPEAIPDGLLVTLKVAQLKDELRLRHVQFPSTHRKADLQQLLRNSLHLPVNRNETQQSNQGDDESTQPEVPVPEFTEPEIPWADSEARKLLVQDVIDEVVPREPDQAMPLATIFTSRPEYAAYGYKNFSQRLSTIRAQVKRDLSRKDDDMAAFELFKQLHITHTHSPHGYPEWDGSDAQKQLQKDIDDELHETLLPSELWCLREVYDDFPLKVFRDHIYQEVRTRKFYHTLKVKGKSAMKLKRGLM